MFQLAKGGERPGNNGNSPDIPGSGMYTGREIHRITCTRDLFHGFMVLTYS